MTATAPRQLFAIVDADNVTRYAYAADRAELAANFARFGTRWGFIVVHSRTGKMHKAGIGGPQHCNTRVGGFRTSHACNVDRVRHLAGFADAGFCRKCFGPVFAEALADVVTLSMAEALDPAAAQPEPVADCGARGAQRCRADYPTTCNACTARAESRKAAQPEPAVIECAPTWAGLLPALLDLSAAGNADARAELARMAEAADRWNATGGPVVRELLHGDGSGESLQRALNIANGYAPGQ